MLGIGFSLFAARALVYPWWYRSGLVGDKLPGCNTYQSDVYVHCYDPRQSLAADSSEFKSERRVEGKTVRVSGWWVKPAVTRDPRGIVILVHGAGGDRRAMLKHAGYLTKAGYHALLIDCHNHGFNARDGQGLSLGLWESESVIAAAEWAATHIKVLTPDGSGRALVVPIAVLGTSQGAFAALRAAAKTTLIRAVVAENPYSSVPDLLRAFPALAWLPGPVRGAALLFVSGWLGRSAWSLDARLFAQEMGARHILLIHGDADKMIPIQQSEMIYEALVGPKELWRVPGGEHEKLWNSLGERYERKVLAFLGGALMAQ